MNKSDSIKEISPALLKAQVAFKSAVKDSTNPHFRSKYADLSAVIDAVKDALNKNGITFLQPVSFAENGVNVETVLLHTSGEWVSESLTVPVDKQNAQGVGSAISYGRRYGLQAMCGVPAEDDDGNAATASAITPNDGALDNLNEAQRGRCQTIAKRMVELDKADNLEGARALFYDTPDLDNEMKLGIWEVLKKESSLRNRVKKLQDSKKQQPAEVA